MGDRKFVALARDTKTNKVSQLYREQGGGFTRDKGSKNIAKTRPPRFSKQEGEAAIEWGKAHGLAVFVTQQKWPFLVLDDDTDWGNPDLAKRLNELGRRLGRYVWCGEFKRSAYRQWWFRDGYLRRKPGFNLAARCCTKYSGIHSWASCGKNPQSNHASGNACDTSILRSGRGGSFVNVGAWSGAREEMRRLGLCLPVGGENWHIERGTAWRA